MFKTFYHRSTKRFALEMTAAQAHARLRLITFSPSRKLIRTISFSIFTSAHREPSRPERDGPSPSQRASLTRVPDAASKERQTWRGARPFLSPRLPVFWLAKNPKWWPRRYNRSDWTGWRGTYSRRLWVSRKSGQSGSTRLATIWVDVTLLTETKRSPTNTFTRTSSAILTNQVNT